MPKVKGVAERDSMSSEEEADANRFIVERILKKRVVNGRAKYAVKWKGYPDSENTWEPLEHFPKDSYMITDFERKLKAEERKKKKPSSPKPSVGPKGQRKPDVKTEESFEIGEMETNKAGTSKTKLKAEGKKKQETVNPKLGRKGQRNPDVSSEESFEMETNAETTKAKQKAEGRKNPKPSVGPKGQRKPDVKTEESFEIGEMETNKAGTSKTKLKAEGKKKQETVNPKLGRKGQRNPDVSSEESFEMETNAETTKAKQKAEGRKNPKPSVGPKGQEKPDVDNENNFKIEEVGAKAGTTTKKQKSEERNEKKTLNPKPSVGRQGQIHSDADHEEIEEIETKAEASTSKEQGALKIKTEFEKGYTPERIIGATEKSGEVIFIIKWANMNKADLVRAADARVMWPQTVIEFYEHHFTLDDLVKTKP